MRPEIKETWLNALSSGEYMKGTGKMRDGERYCCLGVLCDLYAKEHKSNFMDLFLTDQDLLTSYLPFEVRKWAGIPGWTDNEKNPDRSIENRLARRNDSTDTFGPVIEIIEREL
jgi:hypothetical protein